MLLDAWIMSRFLLIPFIFVAVNVVPVAAVSGCDESDITKCMKELNVASKNDDLAFALTEEEIDVTCGLIQSAMKCVNDFTNRCLASSQIEVYKAITSGPRKLLSNLCTRGTTFRKKYLEHAVCYKHITGKYTTCSENYMKDQENMRHQTMNNEERIQKSCCLFNFYKQCVRDATLSQCSEEAADMSESILVMISGSLVHVQCSSYQHDSSYCSSASSLHFQSVILGFTLWLILAMQKCIPI